MTNKLEELNKATMQSYKSKAEKEIQQLKPHTEKGEYKDMAKSLITKREKGLAAAEKREEFKVGDVVSTIKQGQQKGKIEKIEGDYVFHRHENGTLFKSPKSNLRLVGEETEKNYVVEKVMLALSAFKPNNTFGVLSRAIDTIENDTTKNNK